MRAKPKSFDPTFWPVSHPVIWSEKYQDLLTQDLDLHPRRDTAISRQMLATLRNRIESHHAWGTFNKARPTPANQLAELKRLAPLLAKACHGLRDLSYLTRLKIKNAHAEHQANVDEACRIDQAVGCAHADLELLTSATEQAIQNLSQERRGRSPEPVHILIKDLAAIFTEYDQGEHEDDTVRRSARDAFIRHVLKFSAIPAPKRLAPILS